MFRTAEREIESCATIRFGFGPDATCVFLDNPLHRSQTNAIAFKLFGDMQALEYAKELVRILRIESNSVILHKDYFFSVFFHLSYLDYGGRPRPGILQCIADQVLKNLPDQDAIALDRWQVLDFPLHLPPFDFWPQQGYHVCH